jgi:hypothetical protein
LSVYGGCGALALLSFSNVDNRNHPKKKEEGLMSVKNSTDEK